MFVTGRAALAAASVLVLAAAGLAGCSSKDDPAPEPTGVIDATTMRGALLQASEIGPTWTTPEDPVDTTKLVSICGGTSTPAPVPPGGQVVAADFEDAGDTGAQTLEQSALVFPDKTAAAAAQALLKAAADSCAPSVSVPQTVTSDKSEPAYTETVRVQPLNQGNWDGFVVIRHKQYEPKHPGVADTAVAVLTDRNVTLVDAYAIYRLNNASTSANFGSDWSKLVGSVIQRVG
ncbi:hypothetical protein [Actinoplanes sp. NPDC051411]|uniref:hypothetical protein n=1 Tax=Actinoplanes sp. NPDC051411 TaxID=3155522 RepID=UPI00343D5F8A